MLVGIPVVPGTEADRRLIAVCGVLTASHALGDGPAEAMAMVNLISPHRTRVLAALCENLNLARTTFPGARLQLGFFSRDLPPQQIGPDSVRKFPLDEALARGGDFYPPMRFGLA
jgi:hypothetical protein